MINFLIKSYLKFQIFENFIKINSSTRKCSSIRNIVISLYFCNRRFVCFWRFDKNLLIMNKSKVKRLMKTSNAISIFFIENILKQIMLYRKLILYLKINRWCFTSSLLLKKMLESDSFVKLNFEVVMRSKLVFLNSFVFDIFNCLISHASRDIEI